MGFFQELFMIIGIVSTFLVIQAIFSSIKEKKEDRWPDWDDYKSE